MPPALHTRSVPLQGTDRSWQTAVQNINGMISILTLLPVLTGKAQNIKLIASRLLPASFVVTGVGAGRVLMKLQIGILLCSFDLYRNIISEISYPHEEYVNRYSPPLNHFPTGTPERHATGAYINHNPAEVYMVEAWFQSQGQPARIKLRLNNWKRIIVEVVIYLCLYTAETFLAMQNAATGCKIVFLTLQGISVLLWLAAVVIIQHRKGHGKEEVELNDIKSLEYRCFTIPMSGSNVSSRLLSFHLNNLKDYRLFNSAYDQAPLVFAGTLVLLSGLIDMLSTVLIVGLTFWAYPWLAMELLIILAKVTFCIEPVRLTEIEHVKLSHNGKLAQLPQNTALKIPLYIETADRWTNVLVTTASTTLRDNDTAISWQSTSAGIFIGQTYAATDKDHHSLKYLAFTEDKGQLTLIDDEPVLQDNQAVQREFLAALCALVETNRIPSQDFINAIEHLTGNIRSTMSETWFAFGSKELARALATARFNLVWRRWL